MNDQDRTSQDEQPTAPEPQPPVDQHPSSTADSESTGGSSPEPDVEAGEEAVEEAAPPAPPTEGVALRPEQGATNPKTGPVPPAGVPLQPINATRDPNSAPVPTRPASRIKEAQRRKAEQKAANLSD